MMMPFPATGCLKTPRCIRWQLWTGLGKGRLAGAWRGKKRVYSLAPCVQSGAQIPLPREPPCTRGANTCVPWPVGEAVTPPSRQHRPPRRALHNANAVAETIGGLSLTKDTRQTPVRHPRPLALTHHPRPHVLHLFHLCLPF